MTEPLVVADRDWANDADIDSPEYNAHFEEVNSTLAAKCPVAHSEVGQGYWIASGYETVKACSQSSDPFGSKGGVQPNADPDHFVSIPQELNPPHQTRWRQLLADDFTPRSVRKYEAIAIEETNLLIDEFIDKGNCEFIADFAAQLPGRTFFPVYLGTPLEDMPRLREAVLQAMCDPVIADRQKGYAKLSAYLEEHLHRREQQPPRGDMVDKILVGVPDNDGNPASFEDKVAVVTNFTVGGLGTTTYALATLWYHLATHPEQLKRVVEQPEIHKQVVEENFRAYPGVPATGRTLTRDYELAGRTIPEGDMIMLNWASMCLDPGHFKDPLEFDFDRHITVNPAFGTGPHRCAGAHLARMNIATALRIWLDRIPEFSLKPGTQPVFTAGIVREMYDFYLEFPAGRK